MRVPRICCVDLDTFFVSVERLLDPSLEGRPVIVGARPGQRGVVVAASYEVRRLGVHSGMPMARATRLAPHAVFLPPRHATYGPYARRVRTVLERYSPAVQTASIDEFFVDFQGCEGLHRRPHDVDDDATLVRLLHEIRAEVRREVGLPVSAGVGCTRAVAKIASGLAKPNRALPMDDGRHLGSGVVLVPAGRERAWLGSLPLRRFPGIGPVAERRLAAVGLHTIEELLAFVPGSMPREVCETVRRVRGAFEGETPSLGRDRPAFQEHDPEGLTLGSISNECTFATDLTRCSEVEQRLLALVERVCWRARRRGVRAHTVTLKLRHSDFRTVQRSRSGSPTADDVEVMRTVRALLSRAWSRRDAIRLLGVGLSRLVGPEPQLVLPFEGSSSSAAGAIDRVRRRFGFAAIRRGRVD